MRMSVVIPLYNKIEYVERALGYVLTQTFPDFELLVVDDGSSDGGGDVVRRCPDPRVRLISQENAGVSAARNRGALEAASDWVAYLDADDEWRPEFLERVVAACAAFPEFAAVFTNYTNAATGAPFLRDVPQTPGPVPDYFRLSLNNAGAGVHASAVAVRRDVLRAVGGFPVGVKLGEDRDTWARLAWAGALTYVPEVLATYNIDIPNSATKEDGRLRFCYPEVARTLRVWTQAGRVPAALADSSARYANWLLLEYVSHLCAAGRRAEAWRVFRRECRRDCPPRRISGTSASASSSRAARSPGRSRVRTAWSVCATRGSLPRGAGGNNRVGND